MEHERVYSEAIIRALPGIFYHYDGQGRLRRWNDNHAGLTGHTPEELLDSTPEMHFRPDEARRVLGAMAEVYDTGAASIEADLLLADGTEEPYLLTGQRFIEPDGGVGLVGVGLPIAGLRARLEEASWLAEFDPVTGVMSRHRFEALLSETVRSPGAGFGIVVVDLDGFSQINVHYGRKVGDEVLVLVAGRLDDAAAGLEPGAVVARGGGDEFVVMVPGVGECHQMQHVLDTLLGGLPESVEVRGRLMRISASVGSALFPGDGDAAEELLKAADIALGEAKGLGQGSAQQFKPEMGQRRSLALLLERDLRDAAGDGQLAMHYQTKVAARTGRIVGLEALMRWNHPERGLVEPASFIAMAERSELIVDLGRWALRQTCTQIREWVDASLIVPPVAVNVSPHQILYGDLVAEVRDVLASTDVPAWFLQLEVPEAAVVQDPERTLRVVTELAETGVVSVVDGFGTSYLNLTHLRRLPARTLKIDRTLTAGLLPGGEDENGQVLRATINLAHSLGFRVLAQGVETPGQAYDLTELKCDELQGWHVGTPLPGDEIPDLLRLNDAAG